MSALRDRLEAMATSGTIIQSCKTIVVSVLEKSEPEHPFFLAFPARLLSLAPVFGFQVSDVIINLLDTACLVTTIAHHTRQVIPCHGRKDTARILLWANAFSLALATAGLIAVLILLAMGLHKIAGGVLMLVASMCSAVDGLALIIQNHMDKTRIPVEDTERGTGF